MYFVVNADDFGMNEKISSAIVKAFTEKRINRTTIMVNMDYFEEAYMESKHNGFSSAVGLHLNLTKGIPLTNKIKKYELFCDKNGLFNGKSMQNNLHRLLPITKDAKNAVYEEIDAQFKKYLDCYGHEGALHMDSHHHIHKNMNILPICIDIAKIYGFRSIRFAKKSGSYVNYIYNTIVNQKIKAKMEQPYYELFDSVDDYNTRSRKVKDMCFEVECHPKEIEGVLYDGETPLPLLEYYEKRYE